jgi:TonB-dependent receptor
MYHENRTCKRTILSASILAVLLAAAAHAGDAPDATASNAATASAADPAQDSNAQEMETVVVHGIRESLKASLDTKRDANAIVDAITAEDIGKFPNTNVAEAMVMVPGVTLDRRFGQGERVSIDGTDPSLNLSFLDGHPVSQAIWLYGEQPNRGFDYTLLAPEILGRLEIYKSSEARLPEGSLGGTVMMHTRQPLDLDANSIAGSIGYNYNDQADGGKPSASVLYNWKNDEETFGFNVAAQHYEERVDRQGIEIFGYHPVSDYAAASPAIAAQVAGGTLDANALVPDEINAAYFQQTRKRNSAVVNLQFKPSEQFDAALSGIYIKESFDNYNQSVYNFLHWNSTTMAAVDSLTQGDNGLVTAGHSSGSGAGIIYDNQLRSSEVTTKGFDLRAAYHGDGWNLSGQAGTTKSDNPKISQYLLEPVYFGGFGWDARKGYTFDDPAAGNDPANWGGGWLGNNGVFMAHAKDSYGQLDFSKNFSGGFVNRLLVGVRYTKHDEDYGLNVYGGVTPGTLADVGVISPTDILGGFSGFSGDQANHLQVGEDNILRWIRGSNLDFAHPDPGSYLNNTWALTQKNTAAYAQLDFGGDAFRGNVGVRYVHTATEGSGFNLPGSVPPTLPPQPGWYQTKESTVNNWLPSFNVAFDATSDVVLRLSGAEVIAWAPYNQMVNNTFLNDTVLTGSGGNAGLDPYKAVNFNLSAEWYFAEQSVIAGSVFFKHVLNYIDTIPNPERHYNSIRDTDPTQWASLVGSNGCTEDGFCDYSVSRPRNAGTAKIKGFTLTYQQAFGATGFGMVANYTYADGETSQGTPMPYQSRDSVSVGPYYESGPFSARVNYNWRSHYLAGGYVAGAPPAVVGAYTDVGVSLGWRFNQNFMLSFDGMNLLDQKYHQYAVGNEDQLFGEYTTGRRYMANLHFNF